MDAMERGRDDGAKAVADDAEQMLRRAARVDLEERLNAAKLVDQLAMLVDQEARRHEAIEQAVVDVEELRRDAAATRQRLRHRPWQLARDAAGSRQRQFQIARQADVAPLAVDLG